MATITYRARQGLLLTGAELGCWLGGSDAVTDYSAYTNTLTENGSVTQSAVNQYGPSMQYDDFSAANYLELAYAAEFDVASGHTLAAWVNIGSVTTNSTIVYRRDTGGTGAYYGLQVRSTGGIRAIVGDGVDTRNAESPTVLTNSGWTFICATWDGAGNQNIYVNGVLDLADTLGTAVGSMANGAAVVRVGLDTGGGDACEHGLSLVRVVGAKLTAAYIKNMYNSEKTMFHQGGPFNIVDQNTTFTFPAMELTRSGTAVGSTSVSIGGNKQVIYDREDITWGVTTSELSGADVINMQTLIQSALYGDIFDFTPYDDGFLISCTLDSNKYSATRIETSDYFTYSFMVREE